MLLPSSSRAQVTHPAMLTELEQLLQQQLQHECQQFEAWKLEVESKTLEHQSQLLQPQAQAPVMHSGPGAKETNLRDVEVRSDPSSKRSETQERQLLVPNEMCAVYNIS